MRSLPAWLQSLQKKLRATPRERHPVDVGKVIADALASAGLSQKVARVEVPASPAKRSDVEPGRFAWCTYGDGRDELKYKLYVPSCYAASSAPLPLIVMLHGCTQDPDDFAVGTRMNALAEEHAFLVAYPQQPVGANSSKCWNWFRPQDQVRDGGEPKRIAGMTQAIIATYRIDAKKVFVAGMSAGGAMAVIMGRTYPDVYAAVAVHSGLPYQCANNVVSALTVMKKSDAALPVRHLPPVSTPIIVFHGDCDGTVEQGNGAGIIDQAIENWPGTLSTDRHAPERIGGRTYAREVYRDTHGIEALEAWTIHGGAHLWSGGDVNGSHTDAMGPNASEQFVRFFNAQAPRIQLNSTQH
jgi:poly(hydroxyalkanoate) depolymerase family esterase